MFSCVILSIGCFFVRLANVRPLTLYLYWLNPAPQSTVPMSWLPEGGVGDLGITFLQLWRWVHGLYPTVKGDMVRLARLNTLSQWAVRNGRGNENRPQVCCPLPRLHGEPPESPFLVHILLLLLLGGSRVFKVEVIPFMLKLIFTSYKRSSRAQCRIQIRFPLN